RVGRSRPLLAVLTQHAFDARSEPYGLVHCWIGAWVIGTQPNQIRHIPVKRENGSRATDERDFVWGQATRSAARQASQYIDGGIPTAFRHAAIQDDMPIQNPPDAVCDGLIMVISLDKNREQGSDLPGGTGGRLWSGPSPLQQARQFREHDRWIAARRRRRPRAQAHLPPRGPQPGNAVHPLQHGFALVTE